MLSNPSDFHDQPEGEGMARGRLPVSKVRKALAYHFDEGRSGRKIAAHCDS